MRVYVYVDGFNLYYRALQGTPYKWLNLVELAKTKIHRTDQIAFLRYFTARVSPRAGDRDAPRRQQIYLSALQTIPNVIFHYGRFLAKTKRRPLVSNPNTYVEVHDTEEKGSDVNLASYLLLDGFQDKYEMALVLSQDTDLVEPIRMVKCELKKPIGLIWLDGRRPNKDLQQAASFVRHISKAELAASQFPNRAPRANGGPPIYKPRSW